jgi:exodeoxyribonuclease VII large subunit
LNRWSQEVEPLDLIILARGGGSIEELWAFNDERVVRAVAASALPVVSGVGHETDITLVDLVADLRAPTPTGAATLAVPDRQELLAQVSAQRQRAATAMLGRLALGRQDLARLQRSLERASPRSQVVGHRQQVDELSQTAARAMVHRLRVDRARLDGLGARLQSLNPTAVLARGYAIVRKVDGDEIVTSAGQVVTGDQLRVLLRDGEIKSQVL